MKRVRAQIAVTGFCEAEVGEGIQHLLQEFKQRPWLLSYDARWLAVDLKLVITIETQGDSLEVQGGATGAILDEVSDCVIASMQFSSEGISFRVEKACFVESSEPTNQV